MTINTIKRVSQRSSLGFSLIEIGAVIFIIGLLLSLVGPSVYNAMSGGKRTATLSDLKGLSQAIDMYYMTMGQYPKQLQDLVEKPKGPEGNRWPGEPFIKRIKNDGWGNEFVYKLTPKDKHPYELYSYGPKGADAEASEYLSAWNI